MLLDERAQAILAEQIRVEVHRLGDAVGEEHEDVAGVQRNRELLEQLLEPRMPSIGRPTTMPFGVAPGLRCGRPWPEGGSAACARRARR